MKQLRELEGQLDDERKGRNAAQAAAKKVQNEIAELENQIEAESKGREDALRMYKKTQVFITTGVIYLALFTFILPSLSLSLSTFSYSSNNY